MIRKILLIGGMAIVATGLSQAQIVNFSCDFEQGIPSTFATYDRDGNEPSRSMKKYGFENGIAWVGYTINPDTEKQNGMACSGSWYTEPATSDDWLVTPAIYVDSKYNILSWRAYAMDAEHRDGYAVYVSETGNTPEDFTAEAVFITENESPQWTTHSLPLDKWEGKEVYIAFVNNSENCNILAIDDINVFSYDHTFAVQNLTPKAIASPGSVNVSGVVSSSGFMPVEGYKVTLNYNGVDYVIDRSDLVVQQGETSEFSFDVNISVDLDSTEVYTLRVESLGGEDVLVEEGSVTCFQRMVLLEEGTGTWCAWCPGGQYGVELLQEKYAGRFVDIAVHINDQMAVADYVKGTSKFFVGGIPSCTMNRNINLVGHPYDDGDTLMQQALEMGSVAKINSTSTLTDDNKVTIEVVAEFGIEIKENAYTLQFIIVEDQMTGYEQSNIYGGSSMEMGGLEDLPDPIPAGEYFFANVGRAVYPSFAGDTEAFPAGTPRHTPISITRTYDLPELQNIDNLKVVAVIVDVATGEVVNVSRSIPTNNNSIADLSTDEDIKITASESSIVVASEDELTSVEVWSIDGILVCKAEPYNTIHRTGQLPSGLYIVKTTDNSNNHSIAKIRF